MRVANVRKTFSGFNHDEHPYCEILNVQGDRCNLFRRPTATLIMSFAISRKKAKIASSKIAHLKVRKSIEFWNFAHVRND